MGNQARQRQELELWQVVSPPANGNRQKTTVKARKPGTVEPIRVRNPRAVEPVRIGNPGRTGAVRAKKTRPAEPVRTGNARNRARVQALKRQRARRRQQLVYRGLAAAWVAVMMMTVIFLGKVLYQNVYPEEKDDKISKSVFDGIPVLVDDSDEKKPEIQENFLTISEYNRPGTKLAAVNSIFVHYTANPRTSAAQNRSYFESLGETHERAASAHFIIGYEGEIIQCIPLEEEAYAVVDRNKDSISIECCFIEEDGSFTQETYDSLIAMLVWLTDKYGLETKDILRHYDCGGKLCPIYYVEHEEAWERLLYDVEQHRL